MRHATVGDVAAIAGCHPHTVRHYADLGLVRVRRNLNGVRVFPDPVEAGEMIQKLIGGQMTVDEAKARIHTDGDA